MNSTKGTKQSAPQFEDTFLPLGTATKTLGQSVYELHAKHAKQLVRCKYPSLQQKEFDDKVRQVINQLEIGITSPVF